MTWACGVLQRALEALMRATPIVGLILLAAGCTGSDSVYTPAGASTWNDGYPAEIVAIPPSMPAGTLEIASFGLVELTPSDMTPMTTLHVRIAVTNASHERPWNVDLAGATVRVGGEAARTLLANSDLPTLPIALVERGQPRTFDLYFSVPPGVRDEEDLAGLDFRVQVATPARTVQAVVHFTRRDPPERLGARGDAVRVAGWGSQWWADPAFPWPTFHRRSGIITPKPPAQAVVNRLPRWQRPALMRSAAR
jgi:hypothetical protein